MTSDSPETCALLRRAGQGDADALGMLFAQHRDRLSRMVKLRMDRRLQGRVDPSDVLQEAYVEVSKSLADYLRDPQVPFFLWLRFLTGRKLRALHRHHLGAGMRDAGREVAHAPMPEASSVSLAEQFVGHYTSPSQAAIRAELHARLQEALDAMEPLDREILTLRHFEQLSNPETAQLLQITESAASSRFIRALKRLKAILVSVPGFMDKPSQRTP